METLYRIYYFSGTGNSKQSAQWIADVAKQNGQLSELINIADTNRKQILSSPENVVIGFCSPTHGFNFPPAMMHFIWRFPRGKNKVFILNTRAGMKLSKLFLPGVSGMAQYFSAIILWMKGYRIQAMRPIDLPSNWISLHPGLKEKVVASLHQRWQRKTTEFAQQLVAGKTSYTALYTLPIDLAISPVAIMYYLGGRFIIAKSFYADSSCNLCGKCIRECPVQAIKTVSKRPFWTFHCESCMHCMNVCPQRSIQTAHGFFIGTLALVNLIAMPLCWQIISQYSSISAESTTGWWLDFFIWVLMCLLFYALTYRLLHYAIRIPILRQLIEYTSLTRFRFWRRYRFRTEKSKDKNETENPHFL